MPDIFDAFGGRVSKEYKSEYGEIIVAYEECFRRLYDNYKRDILEIENTLKEIRNEREDFFLNKYPKIKKILDDDVMPKEAKEEWLSELHRNMENSFKTSETLISDYIAKTSDELKADLKKRLEKV